MDSMRRQKTIYDIQYLYIKSRVFNVHTCVSVFACICICHCLCLCVDSTDTDDDDDDSLPFSFWISLFCFSLFVVDVKLATTPTRATTKKFYNKIR